MHLPILYACQKQRSFPRCQINISVSRREDPQFIYCSIIPMKPIDLYNYVASYPYCKSIVEWFNVSVRRECSSLSFIGTASFTERCTAAGGVVSQ